MGGGGVTRRLSAIAIFMASPQRRRPENAPGDLYVDDTCIDCGACRLDGPGPRRELISGV